VLSVKLSDEIIGIAKKICYSYGCVLFWTNISFGKI